MAVYTTWYPLYIHSPRHLIGPFNIPRHFQRPRVRKKKLAFTYSLPNPNLPYIFFSHPLSSLISHRQHLIGEKLHLQGVRTFFLSSKNVPSPRNVLRRNAMPRKLPPPHLLCWKMISTTHGKGKKRICVGRPRCVTYPRHVPVRFFWGASGPDRTLGNGSDDLVWN